VSKGTSGTGAFPGYTVNALMENRHRILLGFGPEIFRSVASETAGCLALLQRAQRRLGFIPTTLGGDKGFFAAGFIEALLGRGIEPHIAVDTRGRQAAHARVRMRARGAGSSTLNVLRPCSVPRCSRHDDAGPDRSTPSRPRRSAVAVGPIGVDPVMPLIGATIIRGLPAAC